MHAVKVAAFPAVATNATSMTTTLSIGQTAAKQKLSNLVTLCRFHHRLVHEGGVQIQILEDGAFRFIKPNGQCFDSVAVGCTQPISDWTDVLEDHHEHGIHIDKNT